MLIAIRTFFTVALLLTMQNFANAEEKSKFTTPPDKVIRLDEKTKGCALLGSVFAEKGRIKAPFYRQGTKSLHEKVIKDLQEQSAAKGGNAFLITDQNLGEDAGSMEAFVYRCKGDNFAQVSEDKVADDHAKPVEPVKPEDTTPAIPPSPQGHFRIMGKLGLAYVVGTGIGVEGNYALTDSWTLGVDLMHANGKYEGEKDDIDVFTEKRRQISFNLIELGAKARWFVANDAATGLFVLGGLSLDQIAGKTGYNIVDDGFFSDDDEEFYGRSYNATAILAQVGVGYVYTFKFGLFIGGDFLTLSYPLYAKIKIKGSDADLNSEHISEDERDDLEEDTAADFPKMFVVKSLLTVGYRF